MSKPIFRKAALVISALGLTALAPQVPALAQAKALAMLDGLTKGAWEVRYRGQEPPRRICVRSGQELIKLKHRNKNCSRFVVEDGTNQVTVQYACTGNGYGRTNIRRESPTLVQIDSQGIAGGLPFEFSAEARRVGSCK